MSDFFPFVDEEMCMCRYGKNHFLPLSEGEERWTVVRRGGGGSVWNCEMACDDDRGKKKAENPKENTRKLARCISAKYFPFENTKKSTMKYISKKGKRKRVFPCYIRR